MIHPKNRRVKKLTTIMFSKRTLLLKDHFKNQLSRNCTYEINAKSKESEGKLVGSDSSPPLFPIPAGTGTV